jgi:hypothetical protein
MFKSLTILLGRNVSNMTLLISLFFLLNGNPRWPTPQEQTFNIGLLVGPLQNDFFLFQLDIQDP